MATAEASRYDRSQRPEERPLWSYRIRGEISQSLFVSREMAASEMQFLRSMGIAAYGVYRAAASK